MALPSSYVREINSIDVALKRYNSIVGDLRKKKALAKGRLHNWMTNHDITEYEGFKISSLQSKRQPIKKKAEKKKDAIKLFSEIGIDDVEGFWEMFQDTQKIRLLKENDEEEQE